VIFRNLCPHVDLVNGEPIQPTIRHNRHIRHRVMCVLAFKVVRQKSLLTRIPSELVKLHTRKLHGGTVGLLSDAAGAAQLSCLDARVPKRGWHLWGRWSRPSPHEWWATQRTFVWQSATGGIVSHKYFPEPGKTAGHGTRSLFLTNLWPPLESPASYNTPIAEST
jgi:hypothetical protein